MHKRMLTFLTALAVAGLTDVPLAMGSDDADLFAKLDGNKDGFVTKDEVPDAQQRLFQRLVRNNDKDSGGKLSREEFAARPEEPRTPAPEDDAERDFNPAEFFKRLDRDGDGKLTKEEALPRIRENFDRIDANGDGHIDLAEFREVAARLGAAGPGAGAARPADQAAPLTRLFDADGDGELSADEIANASKALLKLDRNGDGKLTRDELPAARPGPGPEGRPGPEQLLRRLKGADRNGDGKIQKDEAPPGLAPIFDRADINGDGELDEKETKAVVERLSQRPRDGEQPRERPKERD